VHLLLATQRLDEGRIRGLDGHLRYRVCLRTFSAEESATVLGTRDAFSLPPIPGVGYLRVDQRLEVFKVAAVSVPPHPDPPRDPGSREIRGSRGVGRGEGTDRHGG